MEARTYISDVLEKSNIEISITDDANDTTHYAPPSEYQIPPTKWLVDFFFNGDLELVEFLATTLIGSALLDNYKQKQTFSSSTRTYLVHLIVDGIENRLVFIS